MAYCWMFRRYFMLISAVTSFSQNFWAILLWGANYPNWRDKTLAPPDELALLGGVRFVLKDPPNYQQPVGDLVLILATLP